MSRLLEVWGENILCFSKVNLNLENRGLTAVIGEKVGTSSQNSNGAGKTSFYELIYHSLFGRSLRGSTLDDMVNWNNPKAGARAAITFEGNDGRWYGVERYRKHPRHGNKVSLYHNDPGTTQPLEKWPAVHWQDKKEIQGKLESKLGLDRDMFGSLSLFGIGSQRFSSLGDAGQKRLLEQVLSLSLYAEAAKRAKRERDDCEIQIDLGESILRLMSASVVHAKETHKEHQSRAEKWSEEQESKQERENKHLQSLFRQLTEQKEEIQRLTLVGPLDRDFFLELFEEMEESQKELDDRKSHTEKRYQERHYTFSMERTKWKTLHHQHDKEHAKLKEHQGVCPTCGQETQGIQPLTLDGLQEESAHELREWKRFEAELDTLEEAIEGLRSVRRDEQVKIDAQRRKAETDLQAITLAENELRDAHKVASEIEKRIDEAKQAFTTMEAASENPWIEVAEKALEHLQGEQALETSKIEELETARGDSNLLKVVSRLLGTKGVRSFLFESLVPELNARLMHYSQVVSGGQLTAQISVTSETSKKEVREKISLWVETPSRKTPYNARSTGEKRRLDLPILFGLQDVATLRNVSTGLCLLDEVFESVDTAGQEGVIQLLREAVSRPHTSSIYAITHNEDLSGLFDQHLTVRMENETSHIV